MYGWVIYRTGSFTFLFFFPQYSEALKNLSKEVQSGIQNSLNLGTYSNLASKCCSYAYLYQGR